MYLNTHFNYRKTKLSNTCTIIQVEMAIDNAIETLSRLGLVTLAEVEAEDGRTISVQAVGCGKAYEALKQHWNNLLASAL